MAGDRLNRSLVESINFNNSQILGILHQDFQTVLGKQGESKIVCFYKTEMSPTAKQSGGIWKMNGEKALLVSKLSATNYRSWETGVEHICPIARTHSNMVKFGRHDGEYKTVCGRIRDLCQRARICQKTQMETRVAEVSATANSRARFYVPFPANPDFVGRTDILEKLRKTLFFDKRYRKAALIGLGGVGKTQIALQFAFWVKEHKPGYSVFWLPVMSRPSFEQAYIGIIKECAIQTTNAEDPKESVRNYLSSKDAGKWLLIVDNADDIEVLHEPGSSSRSIYDYLPNSDGGLILFTTRSREVAVSVAKSAVENVLEMSLEEAMNYLESSLIDKTLIEDSQAVTELLRVVTFLPLAITQAAAYINKTYCTIAEYLRLFSDTDQAMIELMSREFHDDTRYTGTKNAVITTWLVSFHQIRKINEFAARLLSFMAWIESKDIPQSILPQASEERMTQAIGTLLGYGFLSRRSDRKTYDMHSLVQLATRVWIKKEEEMEHTFRDVVSHLLRVFPSDEWENRELWRKYLPHAIRVLETRNIAGDESCELGYWVGRCLNVDKRSREAVRQLEHVVRIREKILVEDHPSQLASQHELAGAYEANGQIKKAVKLLEHVVGIREKILAEDHPNRLASQHELARAYEANGQIKKAVKLLEHVVEIQKTILAEDHPDRLASQHELAGAYEANGQVKEAVKLLEHVVGIKEKILAEDHPSRLSSQHELAGAYEANGQVKEAVRLLEYVVGIEEKTLAEDHPDRLASQHELAGAYEANGQVKEAVKLLEYVVGIEEKTLAEDHPNRLTSQHELARAYQANGQVKEAVRLLEYVVGIEEKTLAEDHPNRLASENLLLRIRDSDAQAVKDLS